MSSPTCYRAECLDGASSATVGDCRCGFRQVVALLDREKRGVWVHYRINADVLSNLGSLIGTLPAPDRLSWPGGAARVE